MRVNVWTLLFISSSLIAGCSTTPEREVVVPTTTCLTDPSRAQVHCSGVTRPFSELEDYVCHPLLEWEELLESCRP